MKLFRNISVILAIMIALPLAYGCSARCGPNCGKVIKKVTLEDVNFDFGKATLRADGKGILDKEYPSLKGDDTTELSVEGHCDIIGDDITNQKLSEGRANTVYQYLLKKGIPAAKMKTVGYGRTRPIAPNDTDANRAKNRRVEVKVIKVK